MLEDAQEIQNKTRQNKCVSRRTSMGEISWECFLYVNPREITKTNESTSTTTAILTWTYLKVLAHALHWVHAMFVKFSCCYFLFIYLCYNCCRWTTQLWLHYTYVTVSIQLRKSQSQPSCSVKKDIMRGDDMRCSKHGRRCEEFFSSSA